MGIVLSFEMYKFDSRDIATVDAITCRGERRYNCIWKPIHHTPMSNLQTVTVQKSVGSFPREVALKVHLVLPFWKHIYPAAIWPSSKKVTL